MRTTTVLSNHELQGSLGRLAEKLARLRTSDAPPRAMTDQVRPMRVAHVHTAVDALLGESVSANSVSWVLASHSEGSSPLFVRVARGRYVLA
jgi:hypothetical protein